MKHRGSSKIKYEHHMIPGLREHLEELESNPDIKSIIPGEIKRTKGAKRFVFELKYSTLTGAKYLAYSGCSVQEVFIVRQGLSG